MIREQDEIGIEREATAKSAVALSAVSIDRICVRTALMLIVSASPDS